MLRSAKELRGYTISVIEGAIGNVDDFLLDDRKWNVRYLVVYADHWLPGQWVLIPPGVLGEPDWETQTLPVTLTKEQVENSPPISADEPVSRQMEDDFHEHYGWSPYWRDGAQDLGLGAAAVAQTISQVDEERDEEQADPHLRSSQEVIGYSVQDEDGEIGHVVDFVCDDETWAVRYSVISTQS